MVTVVGRTSAAGAGRVGVREGVAVRGEEKSCLFLEEDSAESSSSIGAPGDSDVENEEDDAASAEPGGLGSLASLHDSLPIKRGLSNHYTGKSKSFANLSEVSSVGNLEKSENPFNKKRRILTASKWSRRPLLLYSWQNRNSMPLIATLNEEDGEQNSSTLLQRDSSSSSSSSSSSLSLINGEEREEEDHGRKRALKAKSRSCLSLSALHERGG